MKLIVDAEHLNEPQIATIKHIIEKLANSHEIDILIKKRKDAREFWYQGDWLKHMRLEE